MVKVSVLLPARGRPANLRASVASVFELAKRPDEVQVLVRLDDDDPTLSESIAALSRFPIQSVFAFTAHRQGYGQMHLMYGGLAEQATGDWLVNFNDDMEWITPGWDSLLVEAPPFAIQFPRRDTVNTTDYTVPVTGRPIFEAMGRRLSGNAYCDAWLSDVSAFAGTSVVRDDIVFRHHRLNDQTLTDQGKVGAAAWAKFTSDEQKKARRADMEAIMAAPGWPTRFDEWTVETIDHVGVDYINLAAGERKAGAVRLLSRRTP